MFDHDGRNRFNSFGFYVNPRDRGEANRGVVAFMREMEQIGGTFNVVSADSGGLRIRSKIYIEGTTYYDEELGFKGVNAKTAVYENSYIDKERFLSYWNELNNINDEITAPVVGIFETGALRAGSVISTANAFNRVALAETLSNAKVLKIAGNISLAGNIAGVGYAAAVAYQNPLNSNIAKLVAQVAIIGIEVGVNALVRFVVGFALSALESSNYVQGLYNNLDK